MDLYTDFEWKCQPEAENLVQNILNSCIELNSAVAKLQNDLLLHTSTRLFDWLDYVVIAESEQITRDLHKTGFIQQGNGHRHVYIHPGAQLPRVVLDSSEGVSVGIAVAVDSIANFLMVRGESRPIEGKPFGNFRRCEIAFERGAALWVIERRGTLSLIPGRENENEIKHDVDALEKWMTRPRAMANEDIAMHETIRLTQQLLEEVGQHRAAWTVLEGERRYWQARNTAGQIQKNRQDRLGMGWANHDHHTFRSSRAHFNQLVHLFELLGFHCRERFYAGKEAGWGAQVMENPICRLILFLDVDLSPDEIERDFAHQPLAELNELGTIGLWCALHGDSILKGGMHHLEAQFMFEELKGDLDKQGIKMMKPFSTFPYLKQAFTEGERWQVDPARIQKLIKENKISPEQGEKFMIEGAIGSHLENLQRREGYKGFNKNNVSTIIRKTDPRLM